MRLVIIGNGMAATRLIDGLTGRASGRFAITVVGDEPEHAYNRIQLSPVLGGGVLGVETAAALARSGDNVTLVHRGPWLMEQQLHVV